VSWLAAEPVDLAELVHFVDGRRPGFSARIQPTNAHVMARVLAETRHDLPWSYVAYLRTMARNPAELGGGRFDLDPLRVAERARRGHHPRERYTLVGIDTQPIGPADLYIDHHDDGSPLVRFGTGFTAADGPASPSERSFASFYSLLLFQVAHAVAFGAAEQRQIQLLRADEGLVHAQRCLSELGFAPLLAPASDSVLLGKPGIDALLMQPRHWQSVSFFVVLSSTDPVLLHETELALRSRTR